MYDPDIFNDVADDIPDDSIGWGTSGAVILWMRNAEDTDTAIRFVSGCLMRHFAGDWGDVDEHDRAANDAASQDGSRVLSSYDLPEWADRAADSSLWVLTEAGHKITTIMFPSDY